MAQAGATSIMDTEGDTMNQDEMDDSILSFDEADDDDLSVNSQDDESANDESVSSDDNGDLDSTSDQSDVLMEDDDSDEGGEESDEEDEEEDLDEDSSEEETDEEAAHEAYLRKLEEEAFQEEVRKITMEALEKGKISARTNASAKVSDTMPSASQFIRKKGEPLPSSANEGGEGKNLSIGGEIGVTFKLLKRGHKGRVEAKELVVPSDNNLVKVTSKQDDEAARERDLLKARVLRYEEESAAQAYADAYSDNMYSKASEVRRLTMSDIDRNFGSGEYRRNTHRGGRGSGGRGLFNAGR
jgi:regulator of nonsense transcripts 2